jgi:hypothetical protein
MYRLMASEKLIQACKTDVYQQTEMDHFFHFHAALEARDLANRDSKSRFYILNETGQEYYDSSWID